MYFKKKLDEHSSVAACDRNFTSIACNITCIHPCMVHLAVRFDEREFSS